MTTTSGRDDLAHRAGTALEYAAKGARTAAGGPGAVGFAVTRAGVKKARKARKKKRAQAYGPGPGKSRGRSAPTSLVVLGLILAVAAGAAVFSAKRRRELPPPADAPPRLGTPSTNGSSAPTTAVAPTD